MTSIAGSNDNNNNNIEEYDDINVNNVENELEKLKIIDDYDSDEYEHDRVCLGGNGLDLRALNAGKEVEFDIEDQDDADTRGWKDEDAMNYEKIFQFRNAEVCGFDDGNDPADPTDSKTPFEVLKQKMVDVTPEQSGGVLKRIITPGVGQIIQDGAHVRIHYNAYFEMNDEPFDSTYLRNKSFKFVLGKNEVVIGLDVGVATMRLREKAQFIFEPEFYMGKMGCEPRVPRETPVLFEVEVVSVLNVTELDEYHLSCEEERKKIPFLKILQICNCLRELGNDAFGRRAYREASNKYRRAIFLMENRSAVDEEEDKRINGILLKLYLNMSQVSLKLMKPKTCIYYCKLVLKTEKNNVKALFRYGKSLRILQDFDKARTYLMRAIALEPKNKDIKEEIESLNNMVAQYNCLEKDIYKRMFGQKSNQTTTTTTKPGEDGKTTNDDKKRKLIDDNIKEKINTKLAEFLKDENSKIYKLQYDMFSKEVIDYIIKESESNGLKTRIIKGASNILHIMKE